MADDVRLIEAAMLLRGSSPDGWDNFVAALLNYAALSTADLLRCTTTDALVKQQGVATGLNQLANVLRDAPKAYEARRR